jgi:hypothetical protein
MPQKAHAGSAEAQDKLTVREREILPLLVEGEELRYCSPTQIDSRK